LQEDSAEEGTRLTLREFVDRFLPEETQKKISTLNLNFKYQIPNSSKRLKEMLRVLDECIQAVVRRAVPDEDATKVLQALVDVQWRKEIDRLKIEEDMVADEGTQATARAYQVGEKLIT
jgi:hypothetical protein